MVGWHLSPQLLGVLRWLLCFGGEPKLTHHNRKTQPLPQAGLSPAYLSGAVFLAQSLDSLTIQAYTNHGAHKIILKLMHQVGCSTVLVAAVLFALPVHPAN